MGYHHVPVLLKPVIEGLAIRPDGVYLDGTLGGGGHSDSICRLLDGRGVLIGIDRDQDALAAARARLDAYPCTKHFIHDNFANAKAVLATLGISGLDGVLLDLGVSSYQLDDPTRGFSYMQDAPLDMRMDREASLSAYDVVNGYGEKELRDVISSYGEERWAARIASFVAKEREKGPIETTGQLVDVIKAAIPAKARREGPHPAKRTFQAIRIEVNQELGLLRQAVEDLCDLLVPGGRLCVITFHSLEDRIVKEVIARRVDPCICPKDLPVCVCGLRADMRKVTGKPITPDPVEVEENPRARSAKLRVAEKIEPREG